MEVILAACCVGAFEASLLWRDDYFDYALHIVADGSTAFIAAVVAVDVSDPTSPTRLGGSVVMTHYADYLSLSGSLLYATGWDHCLTIYDVSDPSSLTVAGRTCGSTTFYNVEAVGTTVYLTSSSGVRILNAANPAAPSLLGTCTLIPDIIHDIAVAGRYMYTGTVDGFRVVDIADPGACSVVGSLPAVDVYKVVVSGGLAYIAVGKYPNDEVLVRHREPNVADDRGVGVAQPTTDLALSGTMLYAVAWYYLYVVDVSNASAPSVQRRLHFSENHRHIVTWDYPR